MRGSINMGLKIKTSVSFPNSSPVISKIDNREKINKIIFFLSINEKASNKDALILFKFH